MVPVGKHLVLVRQVGAAGIHQIDAWQPVLRRDLLCAQMLLDRERVVGAALHRGVIADDDAFAARHPSNAGDDPGRGDLVAIHAVRCELREFQKCRARIEQRFNPIARQLLAPRYMTLPRGFRAAERCAPDRRMQIIHHSPHRVGVGAELVATRIEQAFEPHQAVSLNSSRPINMRRISDVPAPIS